MSGVIVYASNFYTRDAEAEEFQTNVLFSKTHSETVCFFFVILHIQVICNESHIKKETILLLPFQAQESAHSPKKEPYTSVR